MDLKKERWHGNENKKRYNLFRAKGLMPNDKRNYLNYVGELPLFQVNPHNDSKNNAQ